MSEPVGALGATASITVRVPGEVRGDLERGVATVLARVDSVEAVEAVDVTGVTPELNAIRTDATVQFTFAHASPTRERTVEALDAEFGVEVNRVTLNRRPNEVPLRESQ